jgi:hypothetical protein
MSITSSVAGVTFFVLIYRAISESVLSGTGTIALFGSIVQKGKLEQAAVSPVNALKMVDFPTFGSPTIPIENDMIYSLSASELDEVKQKGQCEVL